MGVHCKDENHIWLIDAKGPLLHPDLDLTFGRRCICGMKVIVPNEDVPVPAGTFHVVRIDSAAGKRFAVKYPDLVTW